MSPKNRVRDAAIVLSSLPDDAASDIFSRLDDDCQQQLNESLDLLDTVSGDEFHSATSRFRKHAFGGNRTSHDALAESFLWPRGGFGPDDDPFAFLKFMESDARRQLLEKEHPANVALVMATLDPSIASSMMDDLDAPFRIGVIRRLCEMNEIDETKLVELRFELRMRAKRFLAIANCTRRGLSVAADLLSLSDQRTRDGVLAWLNDRDNELAAELENRVFTMSDLMDFDDSQMKALLKKVDTSAWAGALRSAVPSVAKRVLGCMAPRAAEIVSAEMAVFNPLDEKSMQWAVEQVVTEAMKLRNA